MFACALRSVPPISIVLAIALSGCATETGAIPTHTLTQRSSAVADRDQRQCEQAVTGDLQGPWFPGQLEFAACMIARDYQAFVQVYDVGVEVRKASLRAKISQARILKDLVTCDSLIGENMSAVEKIGRPTVAVASVFFWPITFGGWMASAVFVVHRQHEYTACMEPRGYVVTLWQPNQNEPRDKSVDMP